MLSSFLLPVPPQLLLARRTADMVVGRRAAGWPSAPCGQRTCPAAAGVPLLQTDVMPLSRCRCVAGVDVQVGGGKVVKVTGVKAQGRTATVLLRGSNKLVLEEAERSLHDALCVIRCLVHRRALVPGGAAPEMAVEHALTQWAKTLQVGGGPRHSHSRTPAGTRQAQPLPRVSWPLSTEPLLRLTPVQHHFDLLTPHPDPVFQGMPAYCVRAFAEALEVVPYTLAENAGLSPIAVRLAISAFHNCKQARPCPASASLLNC